MSNFEVTRVSATIASAAASSVADFPAIPEVDRAFLFPATFPMTTAGIGRTTGTLNNSFRSITATAEITTVDDVTFDDNNDSVLRNNLCAAWLLTYTGIVGGPHEIVNRASIDLTIADGQSTVDSAAISGIVDAGKLVPLVFASGNHNSADYTTHFPIVDVVNTGGSTYVLRVTRQGTSGTMQIVGRVVEFTGSEWSVQKVSHGFTASATNEDETISSAEPDHSFTISYMLHTQTNQPVQQMFHVWLHDATTLRHRIKTKPAIDPDVNTWIISNPLLNVTRYGTPDGTSEIAATGTSPEEVDITITAVPDTSQAMVIGYMGCDTALTTTCPAGLRSFEFTSTTNVRARRSDSLGDTEYVLQVIDFSEVIDSRIDSVTEIVDGEDFTITGFFGTNPVVTHGGDAVTVGSSNSTTIVCTGSLGAKRYGQPYELKVVDDTGSIATVDVAIEPEDGVGYVNLYEPLVDASQRPETEPMDLDEAVAEFGSVQMRWRNVGGSGMTKDSFSCPSSGNARFRPEATSVEIGFHDDEWGDWGTQALGQAVPVGVLSRVVYDTDTTAPNAPVLSSVTALSSSSLRVVWTASSSTDKAGYRVKRSSTSTGTYTQVGSDLSTASLSYDDIGLSASTTYYYRVFAFDAAGNESIASNTGFATTSAIVIPGDLTASGVTGAITDGGTITIAALGAENFGTGPTQILYASGGGGSNRGAVNTSDPEFGSFASDDNCIYSTNFHRSGGSSFYVFEGGTTTVARIIRTAFSSQTNIRVRYWMYAPTGTALPACSINGHSASQSSFKWAWLARSFGPDQTDFCFPTAHSGQNLSLGGNSLAFAGAAEAGMGWEKYPDNQGNYGDFHHYGEWLMVELVIDGTNETTHIRHCDETAGYQSFSKVHSGSPAFWRNQTPGFLLCNFPGWVDNETILTGNTHLYYSDLCIAGGAGANAEVYLSPTATLTTSTSDLRHVIINSWSSSSINCTVVGCDEVDLDNWYIVIRKADGTFITPRQIS